MTDSLSSEQSATPKTDAAVWYAEHDSMPTIPVVDADFARAQERMIKELVAALQGLHDDNMDYLTRNNLGGGNNHWMIRARQAIKRATQP